MRIYVVTNFEDFFFTKNLKIYLIDMISEFSTRKIKYKSCASDEVMKYAIFLL